MDIGSILVLFALAIIVVGYVLLPILERRAKPIMEVSRYTSEFQAERDQILMNLQEFDMDHAMGKIPTDEYQRRRSAMVARGATVLKELDRLSGIVLTDPTSVGKTIDQELDVQIEKEIQKRRQSTKVENAGFCPQCGNKVQSGDRFCTKCGHKLSIEKVEA